MDIPSPPLGPLGFAAEDAEWHHAAGRAAGDETLRLDRSLGLRNLTADYLQLLRWRQDDRTSSVLEPRLIFIHYAGDMLLEKKQRGGRRDHLQSGTGEMEFQDYQIKAKLWLRTTRTPPTARGPMPTYALKGLAGAQAFMLRWDDAERRVKEKGLNLPGEYQGFFLVTALQLTSERIKLLLNYTRGSLQVSDVKAWLRIHEPMRLTSTFPHWAMSKRRPTMRSMPFYEVTR